MAPSYSERQAQYAAWRDRLRPQDEVIDLDKDAADDRWDASLLFQAPESIDLDAVEIDAAERDAGASDQHA